MENGIIWNIIPVSFFVFQFLEREREREKTIYSSLWNPNERRRLRLHKYLARQPSIHPSSQPVNVFNISNIVLYFYISKFFSTMINADAEFISDQPKKKVLFFVSKCGWYFHSFIQYHMHTNSGTEKRSRIFFWGTSTSFCTGIKYQRPEIERARASEV